jgi:hypothetical protein
VFLSKRRQQSKRVARVTVRSYIAEWNGAPALDIVCDRHGCETRSRLPLDGSAQAIMKIADAAGWVEAEHGTYCSTGCERMVREELKSGRAPRKQYGDTKTVRWPDTASSAPTAQSS